jgi:hypothetical protein
VQRWTYGAARKTKTEVACFVDANPYPHKFRWQFQSAAKNPGGRKQEAPEDLSAAAFTVEHDHSLLEYAPQDESDYGTVLCWSENTVGAQKEPCRFKVVKESAPEALKKCNAVNVTWEASSLVFV